MKIVTMTTASVLALAACGTNQTTCDELGAAQASFEAQHLVLNRNNIPHDKYTPEPKECVETRLGMINVLHNDNTSDGGGDNISIIKDPTRPDKPDPDKPDVVVPDNPDKPDPDVKPRGDNSDANGRGGNKHNREDFTHEGTETAEDKK